MQKRNRYSRNFRADLSSRADRTSPEKCHTLVSEQHHLCPFPQVQSRGRLSRASTATLSNYLLEAQDKHSGAAEINIVCPPNKPWCSIFDDIVSEVTTSHWTCLTFPVNNYKLNLSFCSFPEPCCTDTVVFEVCCNVCCMFWSML